MPAATTEQLLVAAVGSLATAVGVLYGALWRFWQGTERRLTECEADRKKLWDKIAHLENGKS